jgi:hypothetical protein
LAAATTSFHSWAPAGDSPAQANIRAAAALNFIDPSPWCDVVEDYGPSTGFVKKHPLKASAALTSSLHR